MQGLPTEDIWPNQVCEGCDAEVSASFHFVFTFLLLVCNFLLLPVEAQLVMNSEKALCLKKARAIFEVPCPSCCLQEYANILGDGGLG